MVIFSSSLYVFKNPNLDSKSTNWKLVVFFFRSLTSDAWGFSYCRWVLGPRTWKGEGKWGSLDFMGRGWDYVIWFRGGMEGDGKGFFCGRVPFMHDMHTIKGVGKGQRYENIKFRFSAFPNIFALQRWTELSGFNWITFWYSSSSERCGDIQLF